MDFQLHPFGQAGGGGKAGEPDGLFGIHRAAGVGQQQEFFWVNELQNVRERVAPAAQIGAAQGDGDHFRAAGIQRVAHGFGRGKFPRAQDEPRTKFTSGNGQWPIRLHHETITFCRLVSSASHLAGVTVT